MRGATVITVLACVANARADDLKTEGTMKCTVNSKWDAWPLTATGSVTGSLKNTGGPFRTDIENTAYVPLKDASPGVGSLAFQKKIGSIDCDIKTKLTNWGPEGLTMPVSPIATMKHTWTGGPLGTVKSTLESPAEWPLKPSAKIEAEKKMGDFCSSLKCTATGLEKGEKMGPWTAKGTLSYKQSIGSISCSVESRSGGSPTSTATLTTRTVESPLGNVCCALDTPVGKPFKPTGTLTVKKTIGGICCKAEAKSTGAIQCTFESSKLFEKTTTPPPPPKQLSVWDKLKSKFAFDEGSPSFISAPAAALIGFFASSGITFALYRSRHGSVTTREVPLLA